MRQQLALHAGDDLEAELSDGTIVLRAKGSAKAVQEGLAQEAAEAMPDATAVVVEAQEPEQPAAAPAPPPKRRGRPPKAKG
jgi:antitoxin component of MazEF toxin-antitoxin module